jgi:hypothetical protein
MDKRLDVTLLKTTVDGEVRVLSVFSGRKHEIDSNRDENSDDKSAN